jgi:threonine efflux protein
MTGTADLLVFSGIMALAQFSPGPDMILLTRTALASGARAGVQMALGIACGLALHTAAAVGGLALVIERFPALWHSLRWVGAAYLVWLAWKIFQEILATKDSSATQEEMAAPPSRKPFVRGLLCNLLNPKVVLVLAAVCAPFLKGSRPDWWPLALWGIVVGQGCLLWSLWARLLQWRSLRERYQRAQRLIDGAFALALVTLAIGLAVG